MKKIILLFIFLFAVLPIVSAEIQRVDVPVQIKVENGTVTLIKTEDNSQYPYSTNSYTTHDITLYTYKNFSNICPEQTTLKQICDDNIKKLTEDITKLKEDYSVKTYFEEYTSCVKDKTNSDSNLANCEKDVKELDTLKSDNKNCLAQVDTLKDKATELSLINTLDKTNFCIRYPTSQLCRDINNLSNSRYIVAAIAFGAGAFAFWSYKKTKRGKSQVGETMSPSAPHQ